MPTKKKTDKASAGVFPKLPKEVLDLLPTGVMSAGQIEEMTGALKKALIERALGAELSQHLGYGSGQERPAEGGNQRNGTSKKTVLPSDGPVQLDVPRDRLASFQPILVPKHERRFTGFDDKIIAMYARGMSVRDIRAFLSEQYGTDGSADFISSVTDEVLQEVMQWQQRPLEQMYPVIFFDALRVKIRDEGVVRNKAVYLALGVQADGSRDILGIWIETTEGAKFWMKVFSDLKTRGVEDILIAVTDGLKGMPEAIAAVYPETTLQTCIVHLIRNSLDFANWKDRKSLAMALKPVYQAATLEGAEHALEDFEESPLGKRYPIVAQAWRRAWDRVIPFFAFTPPIRRVIYTTNAIESINAQLRKVIKTRGHFPNDDAAMKLIWLGIRNITNKWRGTSHGWKEAMGQFSIRYKERFDRLKY